MKIKVVFCIVIIVAIIVVIDNIIVIIVILSGIIIIVTICTQNRWKVRVGEVISDSHLCSTPKQNYCLF